MGHVYEFIPRKGYLLCKTTGETSSVEDIFTYARAVTDAARKADCTYIFLDERGMTSTLDPLDIYMACEELACGGLLRGFRFASLRTTLNKKSAQNFETMFQNRSINYRFFIDYEEAEKWLCSSSDREAQEL